jgi:hypothetical protein
MHACLCRTSAVVDAVKVLWSCPFARPHLCPLAFATPPRILQDYQNMCVALCHVQPGSEASLDEIDEKTFASLRLRFGTCNDGCVEQ